MKQLFIFLLLINLSGFLYADEPITVQDQAAVDRLASIDQSLLAQKVAPAKSKRKRSKKSEQRTISFKFDNEDLIDIINQLAALKGVNVILPQGANAINIKITLVIEEKLTLDEAWRLLYTLLDFAGYTLMPEKDMYTIVKNSPNITREPLPLYIGVRPENLPNTDQRIRYIYYLSNVKVSEDESSEVTAILKHVLPLNTSSYKVDVATNGIIIAAKANDIRAAMQIILELDKIDFQETVEFIKLRHALAKDVADLFNEGILKSAATFDRYHLEAKQRTEASFFSKHVRIIPEFRTNSIIVLGRPQAIERVREFIFKYLDVELETGKSILHVRQLQYLDADKLAGVLRAIVESAQAGGTDQARVAGGTVLAGVQKTFDEVKIMADRPLSEERKYYGGNKLVVAARNEDWQVIEKLIDEMDTPQPQVLLEILIADLTIEDTRKLGSLIRNPANIPFPGTSNAQAAEIGQVILSNNGSGTTPNTFPPNTTLASDLLRILPATSTTPALSIASIIANTELNLGHPGSTFVSVNDKDGSTWNLLQILKNLNSAKVISHPHVIATNNQPAQVVIGETRLITDEAVGSGGTTTTIKNKNIPANLVVNITPRISSANVVTLDITIDIDAFAALESSGNNTRVTRNVKTNALVKDKNILAIGGLVRLATSDTTLQTPILGQIPILGYFFKNRSNNTINTNLTVFISPTIIQPRLRKGVDDYTKDYIKVSKRYVHEGELFDSLQDPVTRWFFKLGDNAEEDVDRFLARDEFKFDIVGRNETLTEEEKKRLPPPAAIAPTLVPGQVPQPPITETKTITTPTPAVAELPVQNPNARPVLPPPALLRQGYEGQAPVIPVAPIAAPPVTLTTAPLVPVSPAVTELPKPGPEPTLRPSSSSQSDYLQDERRTRLPLSSAEGLGEVGPTPSGGIVQNKNRVEELKRLIGNDENPLLRVSG